uniref:sulfite exporter TauE/SafE family protein n=1 Tax=Blastomonas sp. TaxID=1909299 RepID=UPI003593871E
MLDLSFLNPADIWPIVLAGFAAQIVDGALGMAFGVISSTLLVSVLGVPPAQASAGVHLAEVFTTGASGLSHAWHRNIDWKLFSRLVLPGIAGGVLGAYVLSNIDADVARPLVMAYLAA